MLTSLKNFQLIETFKHLVVVITQLRLKSQINKCLNRRIQHQAINMILSKEADPTYEEQCAFIHVLSQYGYYVDVDSVWDHQGKFYNLPIEDCHETTPTVCYKGLEFESTEFANLIIKYGETLWTSREKDIIISRLNNETYSSISQRVRLTDSRCQQIFNRGIHKCLRKIYEDHHAKPVKSTQPTQPTNTYNPHTETLNMMDSNPHRRRARELFEEDFNLSQRLKVEQLLKEKKEQQRKEKDKRKEELQKLSEKFIVRVEKVNEKKFLQIQQRLRKQSSKLKGD